MANNSRSQHKSETLNKKQYFQILNIKHGLVFIKILLFLHAIYKIYFIYYKVHYEVSNK